MEALDYKYLAKLVSRAQIGDSDAFAELYAATYKRQYHYAYRYLKDEYLAQDALQETYILALKSIASLKDPSLIISWLNQINFRVCYNLHKKQQRYNSEMGAGGDALLTEALNTGEGLGRPSSPEDTVIKVDSYEYLMNQILKLPFTESQVILLKYYQNLKLTEIAQLMDISLSSVKRYLNSGRKHLAQVLQQEQGGAFDYDNF